MNSVDFEQKLSQDGYSASQRELSAIGINEAHSHAWDVRALVTAGDITLTVDGVATKYQAGDVFTMKAGCMHREQVGAAGVTAIAGRRDIAAAA